MAGPN
jgi:hypothetical protein